MSSKRIMAKEWKRKRKQHQRIVVLSIVGVCIMALLGIGYIGWDLWSRTYVMTFEGERIATADMRFFSLFAEDTMDNRVQSLENLTQFLLIEQSAQRHNITLTADEQSQVEENVAEMINLFEMFGMEMPNISQERITEMMSVDILQEKLMDIYVADFVVDETFFEDALEEFLLFNRLNFVEMELKYHYSSSMEAAQAAWDEFDSVTPEYFDEIILRDLQFQTDLDVSEIEIPIVTLDNLRSDASFSQLDIDYLSTLGVGEFSAPIQVAEQSFVIFVVESVDIPSDDEIGELFREDYIWQERTQIFADIIEEWRESTNIIINQRGVNSV